MMPIQAEKCSLFRALHVPGKPLVIDLHIQQVAPGVWRCGIGHGHPSGGLELIPTLNLTLILILIQELGLSKSGAGPRRAGSNARSTGRFPRLVSATPPVLRIRRADSTPPAHTLGAGG